MFGTLDLGPANRFLIDEARRPAAEQLSGAMMSYWANFAYTGSPGRGREGLLPEWRAWSPNDGSKFMLLDTEADGGLRMSSDTVSKASILANSEHDERFSSLRQHCTIFHAFVEFGDRLTPEDYARIKSGACAAEFPLGECVEDLSPHRAGCAGHSHFISHW